MKPMFGPLFQADSIIAVKLGPPNDYQDNGALFALAVLLFLLALQHS